LKSDLRAVRIARGAAAAMMALLLGTACERSSPTPEAGGLESDLHGAALVVGSTVDQWSLLAVPREGGFAEARDLSDLDRVVWTGETELPASAEVHALSGGRVLLRSEEGALHTYDPPTDVLARIGEVDPEATWAGSSSTGLYMSPGGSLVEVSRDGVWRYGLDRSLSWAAPAEGGVLVMLDGEAERREVWLLRRDEAEPVETGTAAARPPGLVMAWGRRAAFRSTDGRGLVFLTTQPIEVAGDVELSGRILAVAASPSTHEVYAALDVPPRLLAVNRFNLESRLLADLDGTASAIRPTLFGEGVLVRQEGAAVRVPVSGGDPVRVATDWRADLPLGLPEARVVTVEGTQVRVHDLDSGASADVEGAEADRWWLPIHWNPAAAVTSDRLGEEVIRPVPQAAPVEVDSSGLAERMDAAPGLRDETAPSAEIGPPPGFYAIVGSARQADGIRALVQSLEEAGFSTEVQDVPDEAGRTWYRGLVGPYRSRSEAEAAARQLLRERRLEAWVTEIASVGRSREETN
jgi:cell division septation protein DedD